MRLLDVTRSRHCSIEVLGIAGGGCGPVFLEPAIVENGMPRGFRRGPRTSGKMKALYVALLTGVISLTEQTGTS